MRKDPHKSFLLTWWSLRRRADGDAVGMMNQKARLDENPKAEGWDEDFYKESWIGVAGLKAKRNASVKIFTDDRLIEKV